MLTFLLLFLPCVTLPLPWDWVNTSQPIAIFRSRPDLLAPILTPLEGIHDRKRMSDGYFFVSPYANMNPGLCIYDNNADLIYTSFGSYGPGPSHAPRLCTYHGTTHLCFYAGTQHVGWGHGHGIIMDSHYRIVRSVEPTCNYQASSDMHEFYLNENGTRAFMTQYVRSVYDLCPSYGLCDGLGYIQSGWFQEIDVDTGACIFSWSSLDHVDPAESFVLPDSTEISGNGESPESPWDYFHINSISKSSYDQGYLISARHTCAIYKIGRDDGQIHWTLGGKRNEYTYDNSLGDVQFGFQHDAQLISDSATESVISIFDNGSNGFTETARWSSGKIIHLDHVKKVARLLEPPLTSPFVDGHAHLSKSQGSFQLDLPQTSKGLAHEKEDIVAPANRLMSFGNDPFITEYAWTGPSASVGRWEPVFYATLAWGWLMNYRAYKVPEFHGRPLNPPALWAYSYNRTNMVLYVSWNGHTGVSYFSFFGSTNSEPEKWVLLAEAVPKSGFETIYEHRTTYDHVYAQAYSANESLLGKTADIKTFVPNAFMRSKYCDRLACQFMDTNNENREETRASMLQEYQAYVASQGKEDVEPASKLKPHFSRTVKLALIFGIVTLLFLFGACYLSRFCTNSRRLSIKQSSFSARLAGPRSAYGRVKYSTLEDNLNSDVAVAT